MLSMNNNRKAVGYIAQVLNIKTDNKMIVDDMLLELAQIPCLNGLVPYLKSNLNKYPYHTGYQTFLALIGDYKKENEKLTQLQNTQITSFGEKLYDKTCLVFDDLNWNMQTKNIDIDRVDVSRNFTEAQSRILKNIGNNKRLLHLVVFSKPELLEKIREVVTKLTIAKNKQATAIENRDTDVIKKLKGAKE